MSHASKLARFRADRGFTLIELMITVAIVALLASIAYPSYLSYVRKSKRTDAKTSLLDLAAREERWYTTNNAYTSNGSNLGYSSDFPVSVPGGTSAATYILTISVSASTSTTFTATAAPAGSQASDSCGTYTVTDAGVQSTTGGTTDSQSCWR